VGVDDDVSEENQAPTGKGKLVSAVVKESLPSGLYRVTLEDESKVLAHVSDRRGLDFLRLLPGDRVEVRLSPNDDGRGRIVSREKK